LAWRLRRVIVIEWRGGRRPAGLLRRSGDLAGVVASQTGMAGVDLAANLSVVLQQVLDALGAPVTS
jgi:hypothetical protein